jgi:hypothetical protein
MKIRLTLQRKSPNTYSRFQVIESSAKKLLEYSQGGSHITYTPHGLSHITAVEENYDWLLSDNDIKSFNDSELFILLVSTLFHDALMIPKFIGDETEARINHAKRARDFLTENYQNLGLQLNESVAISKVIQGHSIDSIDKLGQADVIGNQLVNIQKLAACLSMADICHADESRAPWIVKAHLELDEQSDYHWRRHLQISGITRDASLLIMSAVVFSKNGEDAVNEYKKLIEAQLKIVRPYFNVELSQIKSIDLRITFLKSPLERQFHFQANMPEILKLLIEGVYSRLDVFLRELVQNSLDACLVNNARNMRSNNIYSPIIVITCFYKGEEVKAIRIDDNGIGMDIQDIEDTVLWIGSSISKKESIKSLLQETVGKNLIATFGIGLLSCFRIAKEIFIRTCKDNKTPIELSVSNISDAIIPKEASDYMQGTTVFIEIDKQKSNLLNSDLDEAINFYFRRIHQVRLQYLKLEYDDKAIKRIRDEVFRISSTEAKNILIKDYSGSINPLYNIDIAGDRFHSKFWIPSDDISKMCGRSGSIDILNEGIFVQKDQTSNWLPKHFGMFDGFINISAGLLDMPASRDTIYKNEKYNNFCNELSTKSIKLIEDFIKSININYVSSRINISLLIVDIYKRAEKKHKESILIRLNDYYVKVYGSEKFIKLKDIENEVYIEYPYGRFVSKLEKIDGKQLYHKEDDFSHLQASVMTQQGKLVLSASRVDNNDILLEYDMLKDYFNLRKINVTDLVETNIVEGIYRSKKLISSSREIVGGNIKFIDVAGLPNKKVWRVGDEVWVNTENSSMKKIYDVLNNQNAPMLKKHLAKVIIETLCYQFDDAIDDLINLLDK